MTTTAPSSRGMLAIWHDVAEGSEAEVREWYAREHHFERLAIAGFLEARRFDRLHGDSPAILGLYRVSSPSVLQSPAYLAAVGAPSARTRDMMPLYRNMCRSVCRIAASAGRADGGHLAAWASAEGELLHPSSACEQLMALPGVLRAEAIVVEPAASAPATSASAEAALRGGPDAHIAWALVVDTDSAASADAARIAARAFGGDQRCAQSGVYQLAFAARSAC